MPPSPALRAALALSSILLVVHGGVAAQDGDEPAQQEDERSPLERARERAARQQPLGGEPVLGPDGQPLVPGALPDDASPEARAVWEAVLNETLAPEPVRSFDLSFYLRQRQEGPQVNEAKARIQFLAPSYVRAKLQNSERQHVRGPDGDWLVDGDERVRLIGREGREDVRQIDQVVGIARNFVALTSPGALRVSRLELAERGPGALPEKLREALAEQLEQLPGGVEALRWISVTSPDFKLVRAEPEGAGEGGAPFYEALLGIDPRTSRIVLAGIREAGAPAGAARTSILLHFDQHERREGLLVPRWIFLYEIASDTHPPVWRAEPSSELKLMRDGIHLRPAFTAADFRVE